MHRRTFLRHGALLPLWLTAVARAEDSDDVRPTEPDSRRVALREVWTQARERGLPLLVLVLPDSRPGATTSCSPLFQPAGYRDRGVFWSQYVRLGSDEALIDLGLCSLACATLSDVDSVVVPGVGREREEGAEGPPLALMIEPDLSDWATVRDSLEIYANPLPALPPIYGARFGLRDTQPGRIRGRVHRVAEKLHAAIRPDRAALSRRARQAQVALGATPRIDLSKAADADRAASFASIPAIVLDQAADHPRRRAIERQMAEAARRALLAQAPAASRWGVSTPCGSSIRGLPTASGPCGTGFMNSYSLEFLHFYTRP